MKHMGMALLIGQAMLFGTVVLGLPSAPSDKLFLCLLNGIALGAFGAARYAEGTLEGKRQSGRDLRGKES